jgi:hypothetical protein
LNRNYRVTGSPDFIITPVTLIHKFTKFKNAVEGGKRKEEEIGK